MIRRVFSELSSDVNCTAKFGKTRSEDLQKIQSYPLSSVDHYLRRLDPVPSPRVYHSREGPEAGVEVPVLVTGASSNHFEEVGLLIKHINSVVRPVYPNVPFYFFDLGMEHWQTQKVSESEPHHVSRLVGKPTMWFPNRSDTNWPAQ